jgi:hypothetical protein
VHDVLQLLDRAGEAIDVGDDQDVAGVQEVQEGLQLGAPVAARVSRRLGADHRAASRLQGGPLDREVLVEGGDPGIAIERHRERECLGSF